MSATSPFISSRYSSVSGIGQTRSPASVAVARIASTNEPGFPKRPLKWFPRATAIEPVRVATSTTRFAPSRWAYVMPSTRTSRPSASVLITSTVRPLIALKTSPGLVAPPPGRFSVHGATAMTFAFMPSFAMAATAAITDAAPVMSAFM